jgi:hypothetical protein
LGQIRFYFFTSKKKAKKVGVPTQIKFGAQRKGSNVRVCWAIIPTGGPIKENNVILVKTREKARDRLSYWGDGFKIASVFLV